MCTAGKDQEWHWGFYSCSGFSFDVSQEEQRDKWGGGSGLWPDVLARHQQAPLHLTVGGGDQLYCDDVWQVGCVAGWLAG
jgi:hypothetical protein